MYDAPRFTDDDQPWRYGLLVQRWERGRPALVKSSDRELAVLAELELAATVDPVNAKADPAKALALAEAWLTAGEGRIGAEQLEFRQQAKCWMRRARGEAPIDAGL